MHIHIVNIYLPIASYPLSLDDLTKITCGGLLLISSLHSAYDERSMGARSLYFFFNTQDTEI